MKKLLCFFFLGLFAIFFTSTGYAQQMMIGVRGGVNLADQEFSPSHGDQASIKTGILAGVQFDYWFNNVWAASIQVMFDQKGSRGLMNPPFFFGISNDLPPLWYRNYIEVPLLAKVHFGSGSCRPYLFAGPSIGFLTSNTETFESDDSYDVTDSTNKIDLSIVAGAGISFRLPSGIQFLIDAGYAYGLSNSDNYYYDKTNGFHVYSRDIRLAAGVLFPIR